SMDITDEEVMAVIHSEAKKRKDAIAEYSRAGRIESAKKEAEELAILEKYLPQELTDEEIEKLLVPLAKGATEKDFGKIMSAAMKAVSGRASGDRVSAAVKRMLTE
ncbi:MAG: GatB/YqeY domain-containing protein, partial [Candidatus Sungiibacteriota bacterium]